MDPYKNATIEPPAAAGQPGESVQPPQSEFFTNQWNVPPTTNPMTPVASAPYGPAPVAPAGYTTATPSPYVTDPYTAAQADYADENPDKNYLRAVVWSFCFGFIGLDRFYLNRYITAVLKLLTLGGFGIWSLVDTVLTTTGRLRQKGDTRPLDGFNTNNHMVKQLVIVVLSFNVVATITFYSLAYVLAHRASAG